MHKIFLALFFSFVDAKSLTLSFLNPNKIPEKKVLYEYDENSPQGPSKWPSNCNIGQFQSPISFDKIKPIKATNESQLVMVGGFDKVPKEIHANNNGHGATFSLIFNDDSVPQITGGPLRNEVYNFVSYHFHYPCEHIRDLNDKNCGIEVHFVHFNTKYKSLENSTHKADGLAVIGIRYEETLKNDAANLPYLPFMEQIYQTGTKHVETKRLFTYVEAVGFRKIPRFLSYKGSLTVPGCVESVTWIVLDQIYKISASDLKQIKQIRDFGGNLLLRNSRPVQPVNGRKVYVYNEL